VTGTRPDLPARSVRRCLAVAGLAAAIAALTFGLQFLILTRPQPVAVQPRQAAATTPGSAPILPTGQPR
jgi:hypothetical protein